MPELLVNSSSGFRSDAHQAARLWLEMLGALHRTGYGCLRLQCGWANAGPAPVWQAVSAPRSWFQRDNGVIIAWNSLSAEQRLMIGDEKTFSSRRARDPSMGHPWSGFCKSTPQDAAGMWIQENPDLAAAGQGKDDDYERWYSQMLQLTAPTGLIGAFCFWEPMPGHLYVQHGPEGVNQLALPPAGFAE